MRFDDHRPPPIEEKRLRKPPLKFEIDQKLTQVKRKNNKKKVDQVTEVDSNDTAENLLQISLSNLLVEFKSFLFSSIRSKLQAVSKASFVDRQERQDDFRILRKRDF